MFNIFEKVKKCDFLTGIKFENINFLKFSGYKIEIFCPKNLLNEKDLFILEKTFMKKVELKIQDKFYILPFLVRNSKFNNFVIIYNFKNLILYQKNNLKNFEKYDIEKDILSKLIEISLKKLPFLEESYKYLQIVFPWLTKKEMENFYKKWNDFREKKNVKKHIGNIHFSYYMEVGYEPSSSPSS